MSTPEFTVNEATSQYASFLIVPNGAVPETGLPVLVLMARRMPDDRGTVEQVVAEFLEFRDFATAEGYLVAMVVPGPAGGSNNWTTSQTDEDFFGATLDELGSQYDIDRDRVHVWGSSAGATAAALIGHTHADRLASILAHAGRSPWTGRCPGALARRDPGAVRTQPRRRRGVPRGGGRDRRDLGRRQPAHRDVVRLPARAPVGPGDGQRTHGRVLRVDL